MKTQNISIHLHLLCYNEQYLLPSILEYYSKQVDKITVYDNHSTDQSRNIAKQFGANVVMFGKPGVLDDREYLRIKNASRRIDDWSIVCDADELLWHPRGIRNAIQDEHRRGATYLRIKGFNIYSDTDITEVDNITDINTGFWYKPFDKNIAFNGQKLLPNYTPGAHSWRPKGFVSPSHEQFYLLHYRCIGGVQRMIDRHKHYASRLSQFNRQNKLGFHYLRTEKEIVEEWDHNIKNSFEFAV